MSETEACPWCHGTGRRPVAPPTLPGKPAAANGADHGYETNYQAGCRCDLCKAGHRAYTARKRRGGRLVDPFVLGTCETMTHGRQPHAQVAQCLDWLPQGAR